MPVHKEMLTTLECNRCDHKWVPRDPWTDPAPEDLPKVCPKCKSPYWNTERTFPKRETRAKKKTRKRRSK